MQTPARLTQRLVGICLLVALALSGCAPVKPDGATRERLAGEARQLEAAGDYAGAADAWLAAAESATGEARNLALVNAARNYHEGRRDADARAALGRVTTTPSGAVGIDFTLLNARLLVSAGDGQAAIDRLAGLQTDLEPAVQAEVLAVESDAWMSLGDAGRAVGALVRRAPLLGNDTARAENDRRIWNRLQEAVRADAALTAPARADAVTRGWLELGRLLEIYGRNPFQLQSSLADWQARHPLHPASGAVLDAALANYRSLTEYPKNIALLLPLSGRLATSASAVRDGFIAAFFQQQDQEQRPVIRVYDTARLTAVGAWERAASDGADFIVGPLARDEVDRLVGISGGVPTLALNEASAGTVLPQYIYQFALSPEDEARQAALRARADNRRLALALVPANDWGMRIAASFGETLQANGGRLLQLATYTPGTPDFSDTMRQMLLVDESQERRRRLEAALGTNLEFEPRRRQDVDFIFVAAQARDGRQIRPQLRFHYAANLPVYATSAIYSPEEGPNRDLDGVAFDDMPWVLADDGDVAALRQELEAIWPASTGRRARLYALGFDAYRLVPLLRNDREALQQGVPGMTGKLTLTADRRIQRELDWARISGGRLIRLASTHNAE